MNESTLQEICEAVSTWGGASASGLSSSASLVVEELQVGLILFPGQTPFS